MSNKSRLISGRVPVSNSANVTSDRYQYLDLSSAEPNLGTGNTGDVLTYNSSYPGGRRWIPQSDIAGSVGQAAFDKANTASANTIVIQGVNDNQNTRITIIEGVDVGQNTRMSIIEGVDVGQNTSISAVDTYATGAYGKANNALPLTGGSITGSLSVSQNLSITGNLTVLGSSTTINTSSLVVNDSMMVLGVGNYTSDLLDIGFTSHYNDGTNAQAGFIRDASTKDWYVFKGYTPEHSANNNIDINHASFALANVNADYVKGNLITNGVNIYTHTSAAFNTANTNAQQITAIQGVNTTQNTNITAVDTYATGAYGKANSSGVLAQASFDAANTNATNITIIQGVNTDQNTRITIAEGVDVGQNTRITAVDTYATGAYGKANSANVLAQAAFDAANNAASGSVDQTARNIANTASNNIIIIQGVDDGQNNRMTIIEDINVNQNTRITMIEGVNTAQNTRITAVDTYATGAFGKANSANVLAQAAFDAANTAASGSIDQTARTTANNASANTIVIQGVDVWQNTQITTALSSAQAAFAKANTGARVSASNTRPTGNTVGDLWLSLTDETLYMYSYDGTSNNWIDISGPIIITSNIVVQYTITSNVS
jgi:hypothetical protein